MQLLGNQKRAYIIIGLGYGDEGKGLTTDYCCINSPKPLVIRYNGGQQAGHTVHTSAGQSHIFSNFGSGVFRGIPTYWSKYCTFSPAYFLEEYDLLSIYSPQIFLDFDSKITTHYDVLFNRSIEASRGNKKYGSCGLGFGATVDRNQDMPFQFTIQDLLDKRTFRKKLKLIKEYYREKINKETSFEFDSFSHDEEDLQFETRVLAIRKLARERTAKFVFEEEIFINSQWESFVFEGAQGILLDIKYGTFPYITKSNTTSENALTLLQKYFSDEISRKILYVTRAYSTRHGEGPFEGAKQKFILKNNSEESNIDNLFQGDFKIGYLNIDLLNYALECDNNHSDGIEKNLIITCADQLEGSKIKIIQNRKKKHIALMEIPHVLDTQFKNVRFSYSNCAEDLLWLD